MVDRWQEAPASGRTLIDIAASRRRGGKAEEASASGRTLIDIAASRRRGGNRDTGELDLLDFAAGRRLWSIALRRGRRGLAVWTRRGLAVWTRRGLVLWGRRDGSCMDERGYEMDLLDFAAGRRLWSIALRRGRRGLIVDGRRGLRHWLTLASIIFVLSALIYSCGTEVTDKTASDNSGLGSTPLGVVGTIFEVAKGDDPKRLADLCDPEGQGDIETRRICDYAQGFDPDGEFPMFWGSGRVDGEPLVAESKALVPILFGPRGDRRDTLELVKRGEKWYLLRFAP